MNRGLALVSGILSLAAGFLFAQGRQDYMLTHEDTVYREAEGIEAKTGALFRVLERRLTVLDYHHRDNVKAEWPDLLKRDKWLGELADDPDARLLEDYNRVLKQMLYLIDDGFAWNRGPTMQATLKKLKKRGEAYLTQMAALQSVWKPDPEAEAGLTRAMELTRKAIEGAQKGLERVDRRDTP
jgi:hypothetical protein